MIVNSNVKWYQIFWRTSFCTWWIQVHRCINDMSAFASVKKAKNIVSTFCSWQFFLTADWLNGMHRLLFTLLLFTYTYSKIFFLGNFLDEFADYTFSNMWFICALLKPFRDSSLRIFLKHFNIYIKDFEHNDYLLC